MVPVGVRAWKILVFLLFIPSSCARPHQEGLDELENVLLEVLSNVKHDKLSLLERNLQNADLNNRTVVDSKTTFTKEEIDTLEVDPNSNLELLLETMLDNGQRAGGIHPDQKDSAKGMKLEQQHEAKENNGGKRNFIHKHQDPPNYWPNAEVPFYVDYNEFGEFMNVADAEAVFQEAIADFDKHTCVKLLRISDEEIGNIGQYVKVTAQRNEGCYAHVGMLPGTATPVNIGEGCVSVSTVLHEFCHAIGMHHEQSRSDRDQHVIVHYDNIEAKNRYNLNKENTLDNNPYDYTSIMQYVLQSFTSKNWVNAMSFIDPDLEMLAGISPILSFYDIMDITKAYQCNNHCTNNYTCINGGFLNHNCECYCPEGLTGKYCDITKSDTCGGIIELKPGDPAVYVTSPNYPQPYNTGEICYWLLRAENSNQRIVVEIEDFEVPANAYNRCYHWLEIRYNLIGQTSYKLCDKKVSRQKITSSQYGNPDLMMLIFDSQTVTGVDPSKGFKLKVQAFDVSTHDRCNEQTPLVHNAIDDSGDVGSHIGVVVTYTCYEPYRLVGESFIRCEGDGKWSPVRFTCVEKVFVYKYDFEDGDSSLHGIQIHSTYNDNDKWTVEEEGVPNKRDYNWNPSSWPWITDYESYDVFNPYATETPATTWANRYITTKTQSNDDQTQTTFYLPIQLQPGTPYCLSFQFRRNTAVEHCAALYVGDNPNLQWSYLGCEKSDWKLFEGIYGPSDLSDDGISFTAVGVGIKEMNIDIDDIAVSEESC